MQHLTHSERRGLTAGLIVTLLLAVGSGFSSANPATGLLCAAVGVVAVTVVLGVIVWSRRRGGPRHLE